MSISTSGIGLAEHGSYAQAAAVRPVENISAEVQGTTTEAINARDVEQDLQQKTDLAANEADPQEKEQDKDSPHK